MSIELYLSFLLASLVLIFSPGPVNVLAMSQALQSGWRHALPCVWGATGAVLLQLLFTGLCLNGVLLLSPHALALLRWLGAAYLVYLGWQQWHATKLLEAASDGAERSLFWRGFATSGLNPKTLLFFPSFFPQFMQADAAWRSNAQFGLLAASFALLFALGVAANALFSARLRAVLHHPLRLRWLNRVFGGALVAMGAALAGAR